MGGIEALTVISKFAGQTAGSDTVGGWGNKKVLVLVLTLLPDRLLFALWPSYHDRQTHALTRAHNRTHTLCNLECISDGIAAGDEG